MNMPQSRRLIAEVMGEPIAKAIVARWGGLILDVPCVGAGQTWAELCRVIGEAQARKLVAAFGGISIYVAKSAAMDRRMRMLRAVQMRKAGHRIPEIALALQCTSRTIFRMLAEHEEEAKT